MTHDLPRAEGITAREHGQAALSGAALRLFDALDGAFVRLGARWGCEPVSFPPFLPARSLDRVGYFQSFPQHATFPVTIPDDGEAIRALSEAPLRTADGSVGLDAGSRVTEVLTPAACYHLYTHLEGEVLGETGYYTTRSTCYRREQAYELLVRQWAFTMRELVCVGSCAEVEAFLGEAVEGLTSLYEGLGVTVEWQPATDPFFGGRDNPKYVMQRLTAAKQEAVFGAGGPAPLALASANRHGQLFGEAFGIRHRGGAAWSGCIGIGLERALSAVIVTHGDQPEDWPDPAATCR